MIKICRQVILGMVCLAAVVGTVAAQGLPARPQGYVSDFAGILPASSENRITALASELEKKTGVQLAVVAVNSVRPDTIEQYAVKLFEQWGIGQKSKDNGILLLVAVKDRKVRIEVGYGLEGALTDALSRNIIEQFMVPEFRRSAYANGILAGATAIASVVGKEYNVAITGQEQQVYRRLQRAGSLRSNAVSFIIFVIMLILFIRNPRLFFYMMLFSALGGGRRGHWSGGGSSFGGGFGGFGGGMSGGGGASGGW